MKTTTATRLILNDLELKFGTAEPESRIIWVSSGPRSANRDSFESVRDRGARIAIHLSQFGTRAARIANHLSQFGTAEPESRIIWVSSGPRSANHLSQFGTAERESRFIWVSSGPRIANHLSQFGTAKRESRFIWVSSGPEHPLLRHISTNLMKKQTHPDLGWPDGEYIFSKLHFCHFHLVWINVAVFGETLILVNMRSSSETHLKCSYTLVDICQSCSSGALFDVLSVHRHVLVLSSVLCSSAQVWLCLSALLSFSSFLVLQLCLVLSLASLLVLLSSY